MSKKEINFSGVIHHLDAAIRELTRIRETLAEASPAPIFDRPNECNHEIYSSPEEERPLLIKCKICPTQWNSLHDYINDQLPFLK